MISLFYFQPTKHTFNFQNENIIMFLLNICAESNELRLFAYDKMCINSLIN